MPVSRVVAVQALRTRPPFFGRQADVAACLDRLEAAHVLAVVGPSGCGKSSLVRAGVAAP